MKRLRRNVIAAVLVGAAGLAAFATAPAFASETGPTNNPEANVTAGAVTAKGSGSVDIISGTAGIAQQILSIAQKQADIDNNRDGVVRGLMEAGWFETGEKRNILVIKADHPYTADLKGIVSDAVYHYSGYPDFRVVAFDSGTVTNKGDGGWLNWAFRGWFDRDGMTVHFHKP